MTTLLNPKIYAPELHDLNLPKKRPTALVKADVNVKNWDGKQLLYSSKARASERKAVSYNGKIATARTDQERQKYAKLRDHYYKVASSQNKAAKRARDRKNAAAAKRAALETKKNNLGAIKNRIEEQQTKRNEGHMAIYPTDGKESSVVFFLPSDNEGEDTQTNVTNYPVDKGAPRSNYARISSRTISIAGLITGDTRAEANAKYAKLMKWNEKHKELTYIGDTTRHHLQISDIQQDWKNMRDDLHVTITFTYVTAAEITKSTGKNSKKKSSKSSKTTAGSRNKKYTAITIKSGDTLLGLARKYKTTVAWLQKVNGIKNPNKIYAGRDLYVAPKERRKKEKVRVK